MRWHGAVAGGLAGAVLVWAMTRDVVPAGLALAGALSERARGLLPLEVVGLLLVRLKFMAKPLGFWLSLGSLVVVCAALGALWARHARHPVASGIVAMAAASLALGIVAGPPATAYLAALLGAQGVAHPASAAVQAVAVGIGALAGLAGVVFAVALGILQTRGGRAVSGGRPDLVGGGGSGAIGRREVLLRAVLVAWALVGGGGLAQWVCTTTARAGAAAQDLFARIRGLPPEVTPNDKFYVVSKNAPGLDPRLDAKKWTLEITGLVARPLKLTYDEIRAMPAVVRYHTLECISNEVGGDLIGNALWKGVRFRDLIARAGGVSPRAVRFALRCADGYSEGIPVADAMMPDVMLAYEMNGVPLPPQHGFPVRMLIPGLFGLKNPKWLTKIEAVSTDFTGYWQASGWSDEAVVKTMSAFRVPSRRDVPSGEVEVGGIAYSGDRGIQQVEVSVDGGKTWIRAQTKPPLGPYTWVLWAALWKPDGPGVYTLKVRARDGVGVMQTAHESPTLPDGATGYHTIRVRVRR
jgi:DMSO/TMAO reductase YedYZ molybdopterin-dependent catalytic subunit